MAIELMLLAVNLNFVAFSRYLGDMAGQVFVFFILTVAAAESAIGLAILVVCSATAQRSTSTTSDELKGLSMASMKNLLLTSRWRRWRAPGRRSAWLWGPIGFAAAHTA